MSEQARVTRSAGLPFVIVSTEIIRDESLSPLSRHLYAVLATYADINSREAKLYRSTLAGVIGKSVDTLDRLVKELTDAGIVSVLRQQGSDGVYTSSIYSLHDGDRIGARAVQDAQVEVAAPMRLPLPEDTDSGDLGSRTHAATSPHPRGDGGRTDAAGVAAPVRHITRDLEQETLNQRTSAADTAAEASKAKTRRTRSELNANRPDAEHLCNLLADLIERNGSLRPRVTPDWVTEARLMLDRDGRDLAKAEALIRWCQDDSFWKSNIECMKTFRKKYDRLRLRALERWENERNADATKPRPANGNDDHWRNGGGFGLPA